MSYNRSSFDSNEFPQREERHNNIIDHRQPEKCILKYIMDY